MDYLIHRLNVKLGLIQPEKKEATPIAKKSDKRKQEDKKLKKIFIERFKINPKCKVNSPVCTQLSECLHHIQKTSPNNRLESQNLKMSCFRCNGWLESKEGQQWAKETGNHISRFKK